MDRGRRTRLCDAGPARPAWTHRSTRNGLAGCWTLKLATRRSLTICAPRHFAQHSVNTQIAGRRMMPTRLGNVLRRYEDTAGRQYGLDIVRIAPHLNLVARPEHREYVDDCRKGLDLGVRLCVLFALRGSVVCRAVDPRRRLASPCTRPVLHQLSGVPGRHLFGALVWDSAIDPGRSQSLRAVRAAPCTCPVEHRCRAGLQRAALECAVRRPEKCPGLCTAEGPTGRWNCLTSVFHADLGRQS